MGFVINDFGKLFNVKTDNSFGLQTLTVIGER
jgi:hypothetical protein